MGNLIRVDAELVRRNLARSRNEAADLIKAGLVFLDGVAVRKPARQMNRGSALLVKEINNDEYASRGAYKLIGALEYLGENGPIITGVRALDAGASTGGFTDVLLRRGAAHVVAVDVGYGQILWRLREDKRVTVIERTNVRTLDPAVVAPAPGLIVGDLSFISLTLVIPALVRAAAREADFLLMVKPQFEVGKELLGAGGVVKDPKLHFSAVAKVALAAVENGLDIKAVAPSPLPGPAGNVEYFLYLKKNINSHEILSDVECQQYSIKFAETEKNNASGKNEASGKEIQTTENKEINLLQIESYLPKLDPHIVTKIAAAIIAGPAGKSVKSFTELGLPENLQEKVNQELARHKQLDEKMKMAKNEEVMENSGKEIK